jgi:hypothetical protein
MTAKEKANELVAKFAMYLRAGLMFDSDADEDAKQCALIAVEEIIKSSPTIIGQMTGIKSNKKYWQKVKQEIEKI